MGDEDDAMLALHHADESVKELRDAAAAIVAANRELTECTMCKMIMKGGHENGCPIGTLAQNLERSLDEFNRIEKAYARAD